MTHPTTTLPADEMSLTSPAPAPGWGDPITPPTPRKPGWASATVKDAAKKPTARSAPKWETEAP